MFKEISKPIASFLDMLAESEGTEAVGDHGYNCLVGSTPRKPILFHDYSTHPGILNKQFNSSAAGRYQLIYPTWRLLGKLVHKSDFSPDTQDLMCVELLREKGAIDYIEKGDITTAIHRIAHVWASLPGADYGQHEQKLDWLLAQWKDSMDKVTVA